MITPSGVTTQNYINALKADAPVHVKMVFSDGTTLTDQDISAEQGLVLTDILNADVDLTFGRAVMKQLSVGILNTSRVANMVWTNPFTLQLGAEISGTTYYVTIGTFTGKKPSRVKNVEVIQFTATDSMSKFDVLVDGFWKGISYPATLGTIYHNLCSYVGVSYVSGNELANAMNRSFSEAPAQLIGYTCREVLAWIAEAVGCYAKITTDNKCKMVWFTDQTSTVTVTMNDEFSIESDDLDDALTWDEFDTYYWNDADKLAWNDVTGYEEAYGIDEIHVTQLDSDADVHYPSVIDGNVYPLIENPFLSIETASDITNYIKPIYDRLMAFGGHLPATIECVGNYLVETGDVITVNIDSSTTIPMPVFCRTLHWAGGCVDTFETTGNIERTELTSSNQEKLIARNHIRFAASDLYYNQQSGIDIEPAGISIDASKYLKMKSGSELDIESGGDFNIKTGGTFTVQSGNFSVDSSGNVGLKGNVEVSSGKNIAIKSGGTFTVDSGNLSIDSSGNVGMKGNVEISSGKDMAIKSGGTLTVDSGNLSIDSSGNVGLKGNVEISSGKSMAIKTGGSFTVDSGNLSIDSSGNVAMKGDVEISSGKDLKIKSGGDFSVESGGTFDVNATNFKLDSANRVMSTGEWQLDENGLFFDNSQGTYDFKIQKGNAGISGNAMGIIFYQNPSSQGEMTFVTKAYKTGNNLIAGYASLFTIYDSDDGKTYVVFAPDKTWSTSPSMHSLGLPGGKEFDYLFSKEAHASYFCPIDAGSDLRLCADREDLNKRINLYTYYSGGYQQFKISKGSAIDNLTFEGNVSGIVYNRDTDATDFNNITETGTYWVGLGTVTGNRPSGMTSGTVMLVVNKYSANIVQQILYNTGKICTRTLYNGTWEPWYRFSGTQI